MLDFSQVTRQIGSFASENARATPALISSVQEARRRLMAAGPEWQPLKERVYKSRTSWLIAEWFSEAQSTFSAPERPLPCIVLASDGSQIVSDRHDSVQCCLLNTSLIALRYGTGDRTFLESRPHLESLEDLFDEEQGEIVPRRLAIRRLLAELGGLKDLVEAHASRNIPTLALSDGSLILWPLETETTEYKQKSLLELFRCLEAGRKHRIPITGYISKPASREVINTLRIYQCPHSPSNCDRFCPDRSRPIPHFIAPQCSGTERITDADLFNSVLQPGERSVVFGSASKILEEYPEELKIRYFYLHTGREIARVEIPAWVAEDFVMLEQTHALCMDQARKGDGYPVALAEAHEQATVRGPERLAFFRCLEKAMIASHQTVAVTQKAVSKRARRI